MFLEHGYILVDWIETGDAQLLSKSFTPPCTEDTEEQLRRTENLYRSMSRIMVSLAKIPQSRIGSWTINNKGEISLSNRPMLNHLHRLENWNIPTSIPRNMTYTSADSFYMDLLNGHDNRFRFQGNATFDQEDARGQATILVLMRAIFHKFTNRDIHDHFVMQLTDLNASNIFVDEHWNIKYIIDLEWASSLPLKDLLPPSWLTGRAVDDIEGPGFEEFKKSYTKFANIFEQEESGIFSYHERDNLSHATIMKRSLENRQYWYSRALRTPKGLFTLFTTHIETLYEEVKPRELLFESVSTYWTPGMTDFIDSTLKRYDNYRHEVREIFNSEKSGDKFMY